MAPGKKNLPKGQLGVAPPPLLWQTPRGMETGTREIKTILLVEDSEDDAFFFERALRKTEFRGHCQVCFEIAKAKEYLQLHGASESLLIVVDLKLYCESGLDLVQWLKNDPQLRAIPCVVLSASSAENDVRAVYQIGGNGFLIKPVKFEELCRLFQGYLSYWKHSAPGIQPTPPPRATI